MMRSEELSEKTNLIIFIVFLLFLGLTFALAHGKRETSYSVFDLLEANIDQTVYREWPKRFVGGLEVDFKKFEGTREQGIALKN